MSDQEREAYWRAMFARVTAESPCRQWRELERVVREHVEAAMAARGAK